MWNPNHSGRVACEQRPLREWVRKVRCLEEPGGNKTCSTRSHSPQNSQEYVNFGESTSGLPLLLPFKWQVGTQWQGPVSSTTQPEPRQTNSFCRYPGTIQSDSWHLVLPRLHPLLLSPSLDCCIFLKAQVPCPQGWTGDKQPRVRCPVLLKNYEMLFCWNSIWPWDLFLLIKKCNYFKIVSPLTF